METSQLKKSYIIMPPYWRYSVRFVADFVVIVLYCYRIVTFVFVYIAVRCRCVTSFVTVIVSYRCTYRCHCCRTLLVLLRYYRVREYVIIDIVFVFVFVYVYVAIVLLHAHTYCIVLYIILYVFHVFVHIYVRIRIRNYVHCWPRVVNVMTHVVMYRHINNMFVYVLSYVW